jgi:hypothetical protein
MWYESYLVKSALPRRPVARPLVQPSMLRRAGGAVMGAGRATAQAWQGLPAIKWLLPALLGGYGVYKGMEWGANKMGLQPGPYTQEQLKGIGPLH